VRQISTKAATFVPGPIIAWLQQWFDVFQITYISYPEWPKEVGSIAVAVGTVTILPIVALWERFTRYRQGLYLVVSTVVLVASLGVCLAFQMVMKITQFSSIAGYELTVFAWMIAFIFFGGSLAHVLCGFILTPGSRKSKFLQSIGGALGKSSGSSPAP
jgi:hypothetical protein